MELISARWCLTKHHRVSLRTPSKTSPLEVIHARSRASDETLRVVAGSAGLVILAAARASAGMSRSERIGQEHNGENADRIIAADARFSSVRRPQHSRQSRGLPQAARLRSGRAQSVSVSDWLGIFGADWNSARDGS